MRGLFVVLATAATLIGLGVQLLSGHPFWAVVLMLLGIFCLLFEANLNAWSIQNIPPMLRFVGTVMVVCTLIGMYLRPILEHFSATRPQKTDMAAFDKTKDKTSEGKGESKEPSQRSPAARLTPRSYIVLDGAVRFPEKWDYYGQLVADQNLKIGEKFAFNYHYRVVGLNPIKKFGECRWLYLEPDSEPLTQQKIIADFRKRCDKDRKNFQNKFQGQLKIEPKVLFPTDSPWNTAYALTEDNQYRLVTQKDLDALHGGLAIASVFVEIPYIDNNKMHHFRVCQSLQPPALAPGVWQSCRGFEPD